MSNIFMYEISHITHIINKYNYILSVYTLFSKFIPGDGRKLLQLFKHASLHLFIPPMKSLYARRWYQKLMCDNIVDNNQQQSSYFPTGA